MDTAEDSEQYSARYLGYKDGAKWQKEQDDKELSEKIAAAYQLGVKDKEKKSVEGLDKAAELWIAGVFLAYSAPDTIVKELREIAEKSFIAGAKWAMEQGLSIEFVAQYEFGVSDTSTASKRCTLTFPLPANIVEGDKVIVQIRKKDE